MTRGIVIPAIPFLPLEQRDFGGLGDYQRAVDGFIEPVATGDPVLTLYVNEDGKNRPMSINERATVLWWLLTPSARGGDLIVGNAVLSVDDDKSSGLLDILQQENHFYVEVQLRLLGPEWLPGPRGFVSWFDAAKFALALQRRFDYIADVRVATV